MFKLAARSLPAMEWMEQSGIGQLLIRLMIGGVFIYHGYGKLASPGKTAENFEKLGIPLPELNAYMAGAGELFGGLFLLIGLLTHKAAALLVIIMIVAVATTGKEYPLVVGAVCLAMVFLGPGRLSVDHRFVFPWLGKA